MPRADLCQFPRKAELPKSRLVVGGTVVEGSGEESQPPEAWKSLKAMGWVVWCSVGTPWELSKRSFIASVEKQWYFC